MSLNAPSRPRPRGAADIVRRAAFAFSLAICSAIGAPADAANGDPAGELGALQALIPPAINKGDAWRIVKAEWDAVDERGYAAFVQAIGWSNCTTLGDCLADPANPYRDTDKRRYSGDCADMAYMLRAYYAWKNGLPFSYQSAMAPVGRAPDIRYSPNGNRVAGRRSSLAAAPVDGPAFLQRIPAEVSTAMFRTHPTSGGGKTFDDFYPVEIDRDSVRPGSIAYDVYGHVGIVYDVLDDGRVLVIASHPDFSVTRTAYGPNFLRAKPALGAGLKAWRPIRVDGAEKSADGALLGGEVGALANDDLADFSMEQYLGNAPHPDGDWSLGEFRIDGRAVDYYDFVRRRLAAPDYAYDPVNELRLGMETVCGAIRDRKVAVERARERRLHLKPHPDRLPRNIYGTNGEWEAFSTPSRDARLKVSFIELKRSVARLVDRVAAGDPTVAYEGDDLSSDLLAAFDEESAECSFTYRRADGSSVRLNYLLVMNRLWDLSFDPYHCPERRWGARGAELATCTDGTEKTRWYNAQRYLRFQALRTYDVPMNFTLDELRPPTLASAAECGLGVDAPADADMRAYLVALVDAARMGSEADPDTGALGVPLAEAPRGPWLGANWPGTSASATGELVRAEPAAEPRFPEWHYKIDNRLAAAAKRFQER
ncbi:MAG: hypothetical protein ACFB00_00750 [Parvularculaceae bacterium]